MASIAGESAYSRFRVLFKASRSVELRDLKPGSQWYCSSHLHAAKGQLRHVNLWESRYMWTLASDGESFDNNHPLYPLQLNLMESFGEYEDVLGESIIESFRVTEDGHLLVEVSTSTRSTSLFTKQRKRVQPSLHLDGLWAHHYVLCMNPDWQQNDDWEYDRDQVFSIDSPDM